MYRKISVGSPEHILARLEDLAHEAIDAADRQEDPDAPGAAEQAHTLLSIADAMEDLADQMRAEHSIAAR